MHIVFYSSSAAEQTLVPDHVHRGLLFLAIRLTDIKVCNNTCFRNYAHQRFNDFSELTVLFVKIWVNGLNFQNFNEIFKDCFLQYVFHFSS